MSAKATDAIVLSASQDSETAIATRTETTSTELISPSAAALDDSKGAMVISSTVETSVIAAEVHTQNIYGGNSTHHNPTYMGTVNQISNATIQIAAPTALPEHVMQTLEQTAAAAAASSAPPPPGFAHVPAIPAASPVNQVPSEGSSGAWFYMAPRAPAAPATPEPEPLPPLVGEPWASKSRELDRRIEDAFAKFKSRSKARHEYRMRNSAEWRARDAEKERLEREKAEGKKE